MTFHSTRVSGLDGDALPTDGTAALLAREAAAVIAERGEQAVRVSQVCRRAGVSPASLYLWFADREHLISAAHLLLFDQSSRQMHAGLRQAVNEGVDRAGFARMVRTLVDLILAPERRRIRAVRLHSHGMARHRPTLRAAMAEIRRRERDALAEIIADAHSRRLLTAPDPQLTAGWIQSHIAGHTLVDGGTSVLPADTWDDVWRWSLHLVVLGERLPLPTLAMSPAATGDGDPSGTPPRRHRTHPTADLLVEWAADRIDEVGEAALRLDQIPTSIARSTTPVYQYFGGREGLVVAAQNRRFHTVISATLDNIADRLTAIHDPDVLRVELAAAIDRAFADEVSEHRIRRVESFAAVHGRPELLALVRRAQDGAIARLIGIMEHAEAVGAAAPGSAVQAAGLVACGMFSLGFTEVAGTTDHLAAERAMTLSAIHSALGWD